MRHGLFLLLLHRHRGGRISPGDLGRCRCIVLPLMNRSLVPLTSASTATRLIIIIIISTVQEIRRVS